MATGTAPTLEPGAGISYIDLRRGSNDQNQNRQDIHKIVRIIYRF